MLTQDQLLTVAMMLQKGLAPQSIAEHLGLSLSGFRQRLANSGYVVVTKRELAEITPVAITKH